jgi:hypothetical protein
MNDRDRETKPPALGRPTRRAFLGALAMAPVVPATLGPQAPPPPSTKPPSGNEGVAEALVEAVKREFGADLDAADLDAVKKEIARGLDAAFRLRKAAGLRNADEPVTRFEARPPGAGERGVQR